MIIRNLALKLKDRKTEIKEVYRVDYFESVIGSTVDVYYRSIRDGFPHVMTYLMADVPAAIRRVILKAGAK